MTHTAQRLPAATLALVVMASAPRVAHAQEEKPALPVTYETHELATQALETAERRIRRGRGGLIGSSIVLAGGVTMLGMALTEDLWFGPAPRGFTTASIVGTTARFIGLIVSGVASPKANAPSKRSSSRGRMPRCCSGRRAPGCR